MRHLTRVWLCSGEIGGRQDVLRGKPNFHLSRPYALVIILKWQLVFLRQNGRNHSGSCQNPNRPLTRYHWRHT